MRGKQSRYSDEFRAEAVALLQKDDHSYRQLSEDLGVNAWTLRDWYNKAEMAKKKKGSKAPANVAMAPADETDKQRLARLEQENAQQKRELALKQKRIESLEVDREILKKAAAFFAKESE